MTNMTSSRDVILKLKGVAAERNLKVNDIYDMVDGNVSTSTIRRIFFTEGSEDITFRYETIIRPLAEVLLDIDNIEDDDSTQVGAMKSLLKYKNEYIQRLEAEKKELESALDKHKIKASEKLEKEREQFNKSIEFLKEQVALKDKRMDLLLNAVHEKDELHKELIEKILRCSKCEKYEN